MNQQQRARGMVRTALKQGVLVRPDTCSKCGERPAPGKDGRSRIHGHHHDHDKPLEVEWLCAKCHRGDTPMPYGEKNGAAALSREKVKLAREMRKTGMTYTEIAKHFGVYKSTARRAITGKYWGKE